MKGYWFLCRCLIVKRNLLSASAINWQIISHAPPLCVAGTRVTHYEVVSFDLRSAACETEWMDYLKWWAGVCSWPQPLRWCPQPLPRDTALPSAARQPPLNGWLHPRTYWHENGFRWPDTRSDKDGHARQNSFNGGTLQNRLHLPQYQCLIPTLYSWMMPFCWSEGGGSHDTLMEVLLWLPIVNTVTCSGGAPGAGWGRRENN